MQHTFKNNIIERKDKKTHKNIDTSDCKGTYQQKHWAQWHKKPCKDTCVKNTLSAMMQLTKGRQMNITSIAKQWDIVYKNVQK